MRYALWTRVVLLLAAFGFSLRAVSAHPPGGKTTQNPESTPQTQTTKPALTFGLEDGTPVKLRLQRTVSSADAHVDDRVDFDVLEEIKVKDVVVIPKGSIAWGTVTEAQHKRRMARGGKLNMNIDSVRLADGDKVPLRAVKEVKGGGHTGAMTGGIVATGIVFFPAAPFFLFMHGKDITIPKGTEITAYINGDTPLDPRRFAPPAAAEGGVTASSPGAAAETPGGPPSTSQPVETVPATVKSVPDGADVTLDGKYVGSTPSTVRLMPGDHTVTIEKPGFKVWQRNITVTAGGNITLDAALEKLP
jgi:PEGA domain